MNRKTKITSKKKGRSSFIILVLLFLLGLIVAGAYHLYHEFFQNDSNQITVVSKIDNYGYYLNSNTTKVYQKYYKQLESELKDSKVDEKNYVTLLSQLFAIDFYTLSNKLTNQDIGGIQFVASSLQERFKSEASNSVYKYVRNNMGKNRNQTLPEVVNVTVSDIKEEEYDNHDFKDPSGFQTTVELEYKEDLGYPKALKLFFIHEENKLVLVEIKEKQ